MEWMNNKSIPCNSPLYSNLHKYFDNLILKHIYNKREYNRYIKPHLVITDVFLPRDHITHWGRVTHKCFTNYTSIGSDSGVSPGRR